MAHFAQLDQNNKVIKVIVIGDDDIIAFDGTESEDLGVQICKNLMGADTNWKQTSYNSNMRGNYAGIGFTYMSNVATLGGGSTDIFIEPVVHESWSVGVNTAQWYPPDDAPTQPSLSDADHAAGKSYQWNETNYKSDPNTAWVLTQRTSNK